VRSLQWFRFPHLAPAWVRYPPYTVDDDGNVVEFLEVRGRDRADPEAAKVPAGGGDQSDRLTETCRKILRVLHRVEAFSHSSRTTIGTVAQDRIEQIGDANSENVRNAIKLLKKYGLIETARGPNGGVWLTPNGREQDPAQFAHF
jgi:hypothetical protein